MNPRPVDREDPDRLYTVTGGRSRVDDAAFDLVTLVVSNTVATPGMQSEHAAILRMCATPVAVVEVAAELRLPVSVVKILLHDMHQAKHISARHPSSSTQSEFQLPDPKVLKEVLVGLRKL